MQNPSTLWWAVLDLLFVAALGVAMVLAHVARKQSAGPPEAPADPLAPADARPIRRTARWKDVVMFLLGLWLCVRPLIFAGEVDDAVSTNTIVVGAMLGALALAALYRLESPFEWALVIAGAWLFLSPWIMDFGNAGRVAWTHWIVGAAVVVLAGWELLALRTPAPADAQSRWRRRSRMTG